MYIKNKAILVISSFTVVILLIIFMLRDNYTQINYDKFVTIKDSVSAVYTKRHMVYIKTIDGSLYRISEKLLTGEDIRGFLGKNVAKSSSFATYFVLIIFIIALICVVIYLRKNILRSIQTLSKIKSENSVKGNIPNKVFEHNILPLKSDINFNDVYGVDDVKQELKEIVNFIKQPKKYINFGVTLPKGILLVGKPGVGKTMIAKAIASECDVPFYYSSGSSFVHMYVGMGAHKVKELFKEAKKHRPAIIFIDEIDAIGRKRDPGGSEERNATLNQLLVEMDGFVDSNDIVVIGATNNIDVIDDALLRSGRFDKRIFISYPNLIEREVILGNYLKKIKHDKKIDITKIAKLTAGFSGASLKNLLNEAGLSAIKGGFSKVKENNIIDNIVVVTDGKKRIATKSEKELEADAIYKASKAFLLIKEEIKFDKVSLLTDKIELELKSMYSLKELENMIKFRLIGSIAQEVYLGTIYSNNSYDNNKARELVHLLIHNYAMTGKLYVDEKADENYILKLQDELKELVSNNKQSIDTLKDHLVEEEVLFYGELVKLV